MPLERRCVSRCTKPAAPRGRLHQHRPDSSHVNPMHPVDAPCHMRRVAALQKQAVEVLKTLVDRRGCSPHHRRHHRHHPGNSAQGIL